MRKFILFILFIFVSLLSKSSIPTLDSIEASKYPTQYIKMMEYVLIFEGGWFEEEVTNYGVMQPTYDIYRKKNHLPTRSVKKITYSEVYDLYYKLYYLPGHCDILTPAVSFVHIDGCINFGVSGSNKLLKRSLGLDYSDGYWNDSIMMFMDDIIDRDVAYNYINTRKIKRYEIVQKNPKKKKFLKGWLNRDNKIESIIKENY